MALFSDTLVLDCFTFFQYGALNDLVMRASIPALFVIAIYANQAVHNRAISRIKRGFLILLLIFGAVTPGMEFYRHVREIVSAGTLFQIPEEDSVDDIFGLSLERDASIIRQYVGGTEGAFFKYLGNIR
jgi:hypothetical protein